MIWYHNDRPVKESSDFQLIFQGDRCSLIIREAFQEDAGVYRVVAINSAGEASSQCKLVVSGKSPKSMFGCPVMVSLQFLLCFIFSLMSIRFGVKQSKRYLVKKAISPLWP